MTAPQQPAGDRLPLAQGNAADDAVESLAQALRRAATDRRRLSVLGGGTKRFYGRGATGEPLSTAGLQGVVAYDPSELVITARAGTSLAAVEAELAAQGQCLPFEPPHFGPSATVGGMVAAGISGPARVSAGAVRDYVLGVRMLNGLGQHLVFGGQVMKNVAGYDVSRLMAGSLGTLGLITEVSLKVLPVAPAEATLVFRLGQSEALERLHQWSGQPLPLNASLWERDASGGRLLLRLRGAAAAVHAACQRLGGDPLPADASAVLWAACREQTLPFFCQPPAADACLWRLSMPATAPALAAVDEVLVEWHGALRWLWAPASRAQQVRDMATQAGGHATLWRCSQTHGAADLAVGAFQPPAEPLLRIQRTLQAEFDPHGVFDRERMWPAHA